MQSVQFLKTIFTWSKGSILSEVQEVMCADAEENAPQYFSIWGTYEHWPFEDPAKFDEEQRLKTTRRLRDQIEEFLRLWSIQQDITSREYRQM